MTAVEEWFVYIIKCKNEELYVGVAKDVAKRVKLHNKGSACRYTKYRMPVTSLFQEQIAGYSEARKREREIKGFTRAKKIMLIRDSSGL
ncbi:MAG: GIY-YIG nuclease family protein [Candidatus Omnitrophica bacterium]|nr:GIY-YIG nuclease family protein [Candidatus Omnitrophota bacterium]